MSFSLDAISCFLLTLIFCRNIYFQIHLVISLFLSLNIWASNEPETYISNSYLSVVSNFISELNDRAKFRDISASAGTPEMINEYWITV